KKRCKLSRTGPDFENVIKRLLCVRTFHTRIGGDLTPGITNIGKAANAEQMGLQGS
ncbi:AP20 region protein 1, partial [Bos mutus]